MSSPYTAANVRSGARHFLVGRVASAAATFAAVLLLARFTTVETYAAFTVLTGLASLTVVLAELGMERALGRFIPDGILHAGRPAVGRLVLYITLVRLAMALLLTAALAAGWNHVRAALGGAPLGAFPVEFLFFVAGSCLFQHFSVVMQSLMLQKQLTRIMVIQWSGRIVLLAAALLGGNTISLSWALWIMALPELGCALAFALVLRHGLGGAAGHGEHEAYRPWPDWGGFGAVAAHNYGHCVLSAPPQGFSMRLFAAAVMPAEFVAAFGFFLSLVERARQFVPVYFLYTLLEPMLTAAYLQARDFAALSRKLQSIFKLNCLLLLPAVALLAVAGDAVVALLSGGRYAQYLWVLVVVVAQVLAGAQLQLLQLVLNATGHSRLLIRGGVFALVVLFLLLLGAYAVRPELLVFADMVFTLANCAVVIIGLRLRGLPYVLPWRHLGCGCIAAVAAAALGWAVRLGTGPALGASAAVPVLAGLVTLLAYSGCVWLLRPVDEADIGFMNMLRPPGASAPMRNGAAQDSAGNYV